MTTRIITSERPVVEVKGYDYMVSREELLTSTLGGESTIRRRVQKEMDIPKEALWVRTENKKDNTVLFRWTWFEITIKEN